MNNKLLLLALLVTSPCYTMQDEQVKKDSQASEHLTEKLCGSSGNGIPLAILEEGRKSSFAKSTATSARKRVAWAPEVLKKNPDLGHIATLLDKRNVLAKDQIDILKKMEKSKDLDAIAKLFAHHNALLEKQISSVEESTRELTRNVSHIGNIMICCCASAFPFALAFIIRYLQNS